MHAKAKARSIDGSTPVSKVAHSESQKREGGWREMKGVVWKVGVGKVEGLSS